MGPPSAKVCVIDVIPPPPGIFEVGPPSATIECLVAGIPSPVALCLLLKSDVGDRARTTKNVANTMRLRVFFTDLEHLRGIVVLRTIP